jgi:alkylation response protein AidB-like acyl-CoA dehydrogenase
MAFTEPATGSDPTAITTTAIPDGDSYLLNGTKRFVTHGHKKGYGVFYAKDETERITAFIVDKSSQGYTWSKPWALMGLAGQGLVDVFLKDVRVPKEDILGEKGNGFNILLRWIAGERVQQMAFMVGTGQECLNESLKFATERIVRGRPMTAMQGFQWMLAEMHASIEACRWWTYRVASEQDEGSDIQLDSSALKLFVVPVIQEVARKALQIHGSYGYCKDYKIERLYRTIAHAGVTASSTEIQKTIVGSTLARSKGI